MANSGQDLAIGIDLGTTYCCVAVFQNGSVEVIANDQGNRITPSTVAFTPRERLVGEAAQFQRLLDPANTVFNAKRFIGRKFDDPVVTENKPKYPFKFQNKNNKINFQVSYQGKSLSVSPEEIGAALLEKMKKTAEDYLGRSVTDAVVTVPAYFTDSQRKATQDAGKIAGLNVLRIINEPTAAAMAYGLDRKKKMVIEGEEGSDNYHVLVFDLGGGTFDVSLLEIDSSGYIAVLATSGNTILGGEDFTQKIVQHLKKEIDRKFPLLAFLDQKALRRLTKACEKAKIELSSQNGTEAVIDLENLLPGGQDFKTKITREQFENLCQDLFQKAIETVTGVMKDAKKDDVDEVILVGGSTRIPKIRSLLRDRFPRSRHNTSINPDEAVACGAAIQAALLKGIRHHSLEDMILLDVNPLSLGMGLYGGVTQVIIERNSRLPISKSFRTVNAESEASLWSSSTTIVEGERPLTKDNNILGRFYLHNIPSGPAGSQDFENKFSIDVDGILTVTSIHLKTGKKHSLSLDSKTSGRMSTDEVNEVIARAERLRKEDMKETERVMARTALETFCRELMFSFSWNPTDSKSQKLMDRAQDCLDWVKQNKDATEATYERKLNHLERETGKARGLQNNSYGASSLSFETCFFSGEQCLSQSDIPGACEWFYKAYKVVGSQEKEERHQAVLKIGLACRKLASMEVDREVVEKFIHYGAHLLVSELKSGAMTTSCFELAVELGKMKDVFFNKIQHGRDHKKARMFLKVVSDLEDSQSDAGRELLRGTIFQYLQLAADQVEKNLKTSLAEADQGVKGVRQGLDDLDQLQEFLERLGKLENEVYNREIKAKEFRASFDFIRATAEAIKIPAEAEKMMKGSKPDVEKIDIALILLDNIRRAKNLAKDKDMKIFCRNKLVEGKIYKELLDKEVKARNCFKEVIDIALSQGYNKEKSYEEAEALYKDLRRKEDKKVEEEEEEVRKSRDQYMKELTPELKMLESAASQSFQELIEFLFKTFPPKHREKAKKPEVKDPNNSGENRRAYFLLCSYYHPDKVDDTKHGMKYKVLCEEISKRINEKYGDMSCC